MNCIIGSTMLTYIINYYPTRLFFAINDEAISGSRRLLSFKDGNISSYKYFESQITLVIEKLKDIYDINSVVIIPSHQKDSYCSNMKLLAKYISSLIQAYDDSDVLTRISTIDKLTSGGNRSIDTHLVSISVNSQRVVGKRILLIDDVVTTGNSMIACEKILNAANADSVTCLSLAKTTNNIEQVLKH